METTTQQTTEAKKPKVDVVDVPPEQQPQIVEIQHKEEPQKEAPPEIVTTYSFNNFAQSICRIALLSGFVMSLLFGFYFYPETTKATQDLVDKIQAQHAKPSVLFNAWRAKQARS